MLAKAGVTVTLDPAEWRLVLAPLVTTRKVWTSLSAAGGEAADRLRAEAYDRIRQNLVQQLKEAAMRR